MSRHTGIDRALVKEWLRFGSVGIVATLTYTIVSLSAFEIGASALVANLVGYLASVAISYFGHASFSFRSRQRHAVQGPKFILLSGFTYLLTNIVLFVGVNVLQFSFLGATIAVACTIPVVTWVLARSWVFSSKSD